MIVGFVLWPAIEFGMEIEMNTPTCHGEPMDFQEYHLSLLEKSYTYQCSLCKNIRQVKNIKRVAVRDLFWMVFKVK